MVEAIREGDIPGVQLRCRRLLSQPPEEVWSWLTQADRLRLWAAEEASADLSLRGFLALEGSGERGERRRERGTTLEIRPPERWILAFERLDAGWTAPTRLTLRLVALAQGCDLDLLQQGFQQLPLSICLTVWEEYRRRWRQALQRLDLALPLPAQR